MKKYIILSLLFLLATNPIYSKASDTQNQQPKQRPALSTNATAASNKKTATPSINQVKNQNPNKTLNENETQQSNLEIPENEELNQDVSESFTKVSDQVHQLIETVGAKGGIGQQVRVIAQNQIKLQDKIKTDFNELNARGKLVKLLIGSNKKVAKSVEQKIEQNQLMIQQLEELKLQTQNSADLQQLQETIDLMIYQNTSLQNKIDKENKTNGIFGWLIKLLD